MLNLEPINLSLPDSDIRYYPNFLDSDQAAKVFKDLKRNIPWRLEEVRVFGKWYNQPRLTALTAINNKSYTYSGLELTPIKMSGSVMAIKKQIEPIAKAVFTTCLLNLYRDGQDSNGWHADDEKELGENPVIASISLGAERTFKLRHKKHPHKKHKMVLENGSLLVMAGPTQHYWQHQLPKTAVKIGERINLTFRVIQ